MESWKPIPRLPGYEASDEGRIRSIDRVVTDSRGRSYPVRGRLLSLGRSPNGYVRFNTSGVPPHAVHVCVLEAFIGPRPDGMHGAHNDGKKDNNRLDNLRWATPVENAADKAAHGTTYRPRGELHHAAKITEHQVREIRRLHQNGVMQTRISVLTGISKKTVNSIVKRKSWAHVG